MPNVIWTGTHSAMIQQYPQFCEEEEEEEEEEVKPLSCATLFRLLEVGEASQ